VLSEVLANPTSDPDAPGYNPLRRWPPSDRASVEDEYVELVNYASEVVDLGGWTIADSRELRHAFPRSFALGSSNAVVVYGGLTTGGAANLEALAFPATIGAEGLDLDDAGREMILLRNAEHRLVMRVVYQGEDLPRMGSLARYPERNGPLVAHHLVGMNPASPGFRNNGHLFSEAADKEIRLHIACPDQETIRLDWECTPGLSYTVWVADNLKGPYLSLATDLQYATPAAAFDNDCDAGCPTRFYRVSVP
jgi:hypothetical protein